ncbi:hypothetical protein [Ruegeria arenilitoris]|uniref:hypothetical protein n=1 Tax=Ruegeria arenilitoris TaxID=1173585 RepID=UPI00147BFCAE|nr:hypothetical protein [Ruegeria arenilitoris]
MRLLIACLLALPLVTTTPATAQDKDDWEFVVRDKDRLQAYFKWNDFYVTINYDRKDDSWRLLFNHPEPLNLDVWTYFDQNDPTSYDAINREAVLNFNYLEVFDENDESIFLADRSICDIRAEYSCVLHDQDSTLIMVPLTLEQVQTIAAAQYGKIYCIQAKNQEDGSYDRTSFQFPLRREATTAALVKMLTTAGFEAPFLDDTPPPPQASASQSCGPECSHVLRADSFVICKTSELTDNLQDLARGVASVSNSIDDLEPVAKLANSAGCVLLSTAFETGVTVVQKDTEARSVKIQSGMLNGWVSASVVQANGG